MIADGIRLVALAACAIVGLGTLFFVAEQVGEASDNTVVAITDEGKRREGGNVNTPSPDRATELRREADHGGFRELVDDGNDILLAPFASVVNSDNIWAQRGVAIVLALLVYGGFGLFVARATGMKKKASSGQMYDPRRDR